MGNTWSDGAKIPEKFGSPPHVWGILMFIIVTVIQCRFTPTCVGNTSLNAKKDLGVYGSPPHVWGILILPNPLGFILRFTPTCVGNTLVPGPNSPNISVHPHMCGEYVGSIDIGGLLGGSPPHVWGILFD